MVFLRGGLFSFLLVNFFGGKGEFNKEIRHANTQHTIMNTLIHPIIACISYNFFDELINNM